MRVHEAEFMFYAYAHLRSYNALRVLHFSAFIIEVFTYTHTRCFLCGILLHCSLGYMYIMLSRLAFMLLLRYILGTGMQILVIRCFWVRLGFLPSSGRQKAESYPKILKGAVLLPL